MTTTHIMLDLETWGTTPGSDLRSIGACVFDPMTGAVNPRDGDVHPSHFYVATDNPIVAEFVDSSNRDYLRKYPLTRDPKTVTWWSEQSAEAQAAFANPIDLREALHQFTAWIERASWHYPNACGDGEPGPICLWSHGASFDTPILAAAYAAVGLPVPWHYRAPRDTRTAFDMAAITDHSAWLDQHSIGNEVKHHALDDAIVQARAVCGAFDMVSELGTEYEKWHPKIKLLNNA